MTDRDREAFEAAWKEHESLMEQMEHFADRADFGAGWQAALVHAREAGAQEPVAWQWRYRYRDDNQGPASEWSDWEAFERLLTAAKMLYANAEGCAVNHYGEDFALHGLPGWLADTQTDILAAEAILTHARTQSEPVAWQHRLAVPGGWTEWREGPAPFPRPKMVYVEERINPAPAQEPVAHPFAAGVEFYPLDRCHVWRRDSTQEWVLELEGTINDCYFNSRHTQPLSVKPEDVPGLPTHYPAPAQEPVAVPAGDDDYRSAFEKVAAGDGLDVASWDADEGMYADGDTQWCWQGWQECLKFLRHLAAAPISPAADGGVKVRELEWMCQEHAGPESTTKWEAATEFGRYIVAWRRGGDWRYEPPTVFGGSGGYPSPKIAIVAAQADYECRILSALEPSPSQWIAGAEAEAFKAGALADREMIAKHFQEAAEDSEKWMKKLPSGSPAWCTHANNAVEAGRVIASIRALPLPTPAGEG